MAFIKVKKCLKEPKQLIKLILLVLCVCVTIYQLAECVAKILSPPISTHYKFRLNETIRYPSLTICRKPAYKTAQFPTYGLKETTKLAYDKAFINFDFDNYTIVDFLSGTTYSLLESIPLYAFGGSGLNSDVEIHVSYLLGSGLCHTFVPRVNSNQFSEAGGYFLYFRHSTTVKEKDSYGISTSGFHIYMHDSNEILTDEDEQNNSFMEYIYLESNEDIRVSLKLQTYSQISTATEPCVSDPNYSKSKCQEECIHQQIADKVGCVLPWLRVNATNYPQCNDYASVSTLISGFNSLNRTIFLASCNYCLISCNITMYSSYVQSRKEADSLLQSSSVISIYYSSNLITEMDEVLGYDWNGFLSDIGGSMGFLLGLSVIGVITMIESGIKLVCGVGHRRDEETVNKSSNNNDEIVLEGDDDDSKNLKKNIVDYLNECDYYYAKPSSGGNNDDNNTKKY